jgi:flagellum-specific ATP synthase/type III secretion protein N (ATPase)
MNEPVADTVRGILDGHIVLSRKLAGRGHYPAIDVLQSISRSMHDLVPPEVTQLAGQIREIIAAYNDAEDLLTIGAYKAGQNPRVDRAVQKIDAVQSFLRQGIGDHMSLYDSWQAMADIVEG